MIRRATTPKTKEAEIMEIELSSADAIEVATEKLWLEGLSLTEAKKTAKKDQELLRRGSIKAK